MMPSKTDSAALFPLTITQQQNPLDQGATWYRSGWSVVAFSAGSVVGCSYHDNRLAKAMMYVNLRAVLGRG